MTDQEIDRYFEALDCAIRPLGPSNFQEAVQAFYPWLAGLLAKLSALRDRETAREMLRQLPEAEGVAFEHTLQLLPKLVYAVRQSAPGVLKQLPHDPGGRPRTSTPNEDQKICAEVAHHKAQGVKQTFAYSRVSQKFGVSPRKVQRIWNDEQKRLKGEQIK